MISIRSTSEAGRRSTSMFRLVSPSSRGRPSSRTCVYSLPMPRSLMSRERFTPGMSRPASGARRHRRSGRCTAEAVRLRSRQSRWARWRGHPARLRPRRRLRFHRPLKRCRQAALQDRKKVTVPAWEQVEPFERVLIFWERLLRGLCLSFGRNTQRGSAVSVS